MNCPESEILSAYVDREAAWGETARVLAHLPRCGRCRASVRLMARLALELRSRGAPPMPDDLRGALERMTPEGNMIFDAPPGPRLSLRGDEAQRAGACEPRAARRGIVLRWPSAAGLAAACAAAAIVFWRRSAAAAPEVPLDFLVAAHRRYAAALSEPGNRRRGGARAGSEAAGARSRAEPPAELCARDRGRGSTPCPRPDRPGRASGDESAAGTRSVSSAATAAREGPAAAPWETELRASRGGGPGPRLPRALPSGYVFAGVAVLPSKRGGILQARYWDGRGLLSFFECPKGARLALGAEPERTLKVGAARGRLLVRGDDNVLEWHEDGRRYVLVGRLPPESLRAVAESVR